MKNTLYDPKNPVYIIGGGASLAAFDWGLLDGKQVMALNTAHRKATTAQAMFFADMNFYKQWKDVHPESDFWRFKGKVYTSLDAFKKHPRIKHIATGKSYCTGAQSIIAAKKLGAKTIVLIGFDGIAGHWHEGTHLQHSGSVSPSAYDRYQTEFEAIAQSVKGVRVINANPDSAITCFEFMGLDESLNLTIRSK